MLTGFIARSALYFLIWNLISFFLTKWSREQDSPTAPDHTARFKAVSGPGILLYAFTISFAVIDWVMSIDPGWISTIYGLLILIGQLLSALCLAIVIERILFRYKPMSELLKPEQVHDHGKFMLTFIMLWAYFSFSQWLIIWSGNLPDEITWYMRRLNNGWGWVGLLLVIGQFCGPFVLLLSRPFKRDVTRLVWLAVWMLLMRWVDLYWIIEPNFSTGFRVTVGRNCRAGGHGWIVALVFLPEPEGDAADPGLRSVCQGSAGAGARMSDPTKHGHHREHAEYEREDLTARSVFTFLIGLAVMGVLVFGFLK